MIPSWLIIGAVTFLVAFGSFFITPRDVKWFAQLTRPRWLVFEPLIPLIWTVIFVCGAASAYLVWQKNPGSLFTWLLMSCYLLLEIIRKMGLKPRPSRATLLLYAFSLP
jgi:tryptophan-rich sensory protein